MKKLDDRNRLKHMLDAALDARKLLVNRVGPS